MSMNPVVLICLPNQPYLLGTFDTTRFRSWWRSNPFPDEIEEIKKGFHIFGRTHLAIAKRTDGRWAIYRSINYGVDWVRVFLAAEGEVIYDLVLIKYGWAIMNTSLGFYETIKAGSTWDLVESLPGAQNAPAFANIGSDSTHHDILVCTDGRYIWRSLDIARTWTQVCDLQSIAHYQNYVRTVPFYYKGLSKAAVAGANGRVYVSHGPFLVWSNTSGETWESVPHWDHKDSWDHPPPTNIVWNRLWSNNPKFLISEIKIGSVDGSGGDNVGYVFKLDDLYPVDGETHLFSRVFVTYSLGGYNNFYFKPIFQQFITPDSSGQHLSSYEVAVVGESYNDRLIFSAQTTVDGDGNSIPSLKFSSNGGATWTTVDLSIVRVGDPSEGGMSSGSMVDDCFARLTWVAPACNNMGHYFINELSRVQCQSYEMDVEIEVEKTLETEQKVDAIVVKIGEKDDSVDAIVAKDQPKPYEVDALAEGVGSKTYRIDRGIEGEVERTESVDAIVAKDKAVEDSLDALIQKNQRLLYRVAVGLHDQNSKSYLVGVKIVKSGLIKRLSRIERLSPQMLDLYLPYIPYNPYDSAWEYV